MSVIGHAHARGTSSMSRAKAETTVRDAWFDGEEHTSVGG